MFKSGLESIEKCLAIETQSTVYSSGDSCFCATYNPKNCDKHRSMMRQRITGGDHRVVAYFGYSKAIIHIQYDVDSVRQAMH